MRSPDSGPLPPLWEYVWTHLGQFVGFAVLGVALVAFGATLGPGRASAWGRSLGLTVSVFGLAILASKRYPAWFGAIGLLGGLGTLASGAAQASTGFSPLAMSLSSFTSSALLLWAIIAGMLMWRFRPGAPSSD